MYDSPFKNFVSIITCGVLPVAAIVWPFFFFKVGLAVLLIIAQLLVLCLLNMLVEKIADDDDKVEFFGTIFLIGLFVLACYWPWIVVNYKLAIIFVLAQIAVLSIGIDIITGGEMDFFEIVFLVALGLLAAYWPWIVCPFKPALIIFVAEIGAILLFGGAYIEVEPMKIIGICVLALLAIGWPWLFMKYNLALIIIFAELLLLIVIYEIFKGFEDDGIVIGMFVLFMILAVGWPWLAFMGMEKYLVYSIVGSVGSGVVAGFIIKMITMFKK